MTSGNGIPKSYVCIFEKLRPGFTVKVPELQFEAENDEKAYRYVIDEILHKERGSEALESLLLSRVMGDTTPTAREVMMRWRWSNGWEFTDGRKSGLFEAPPSRTGWYSDREKA